MQLKKNKGQRKIMTLEKFVTSFKKKEEKRNIKKFRIWETNDTTNKASQEI